MSKYFGDGADIFKGIMPTFYVGGKEYHTVADAFGGTDNSIMDL
ncbi:hypothetical protein ABID23_001086 [Bartonella silvatica]|uniref:Uncharacterized protein n=1 Tax=Bartonella silvatica TaxID=357760 RepID=A0ABV2HHG7_9HYPH